MELNLLYQFWIHTELVRSIGPLEYIFNTASHHRVHHGANRYCLDKNYAGVLIIWDRLVVQSRHFLTVQYFQIVWYLSGRESWCWDSVWAGGSATVLESYQAPGISEYLVIFPALPSVSDILLWQGAGEGKVHDYLVWCSLSSLERAWLVPWHWQTRRHLLCCRGCDSVGYSWSAVSLETSEGQVWSFSISSPSSLHSHSLPPLLPVHRLSPGQYQGKHCPNTAYPAPCLHTGSAGVPGQLCHPHPLPAVGPDQHRLALWEKLAGLGEWDGKVLGVSGIATHHTSTRHCTSSCGAAGILRSGYFSHQRCNIFIFSLFCGCFGPTLLSVCKI